MSGPVKIFNSIEAANEALPLNSIKRLILDGREFCIVRTTKGIKLFGTVCPHQGSPLLKGWVNNYDEIICPLHEYRFDLVTGREVDQRCRDLPTLKIEIINEGVFAFV